VTLPQQIPTAVWRGQQLGTAEVYRSGSVIATVPLLAEAAVCDPHAVTETPAQAAVITTPPAGVWERATRAATRTMGMLSLRLLGTPISAK
jgi:hypothetical protein